MTPEQIADRIIANNPPFTGPRAVFDLSTGKHKRHAAALIVYIRKNRKALKAFGRNADQIGRCDRQLLDGVAIHRRRAMGQGPKRKLVVIDGGRMAELEG